MKKLFSVIIFFAAAVILTNCKKKAVDKHVPPDVTFKTAAKFITGDCTLPKQDTVWIGITATKTEDDLKSYNLSYAYDGAGTTTTFFNYYMTSAEYNGYSNDQRIITRNQNGTEKWVASIVDRDGNITQKTIIITVQ